jgi:hypothetical protein
LYVIAPYVKFELFSVQGTHKVTKMKKSVYISQGSLAKLARESRHLQDFSSVNSGHLILCASTAALMKRWLQALALYIEGIVLVGDAHRCNFAIISGNGQAIQFVVSAMQKSSNIWRSPCCW